eukprot:180333-Chlamydomonas_euryale.AAC.1
MGGERWRRHGRAMRCPTTAIRPQQGRAGEVPVGGGEGSGAERARCRWEGVKRVLSSGGEEVGRAIGGKVPEERATGGVTGTRRGGRRQGGEEGGIGRDHVQAHGKLAYNWTDGQMR